MRTEDNLQIACINWFKYQYPNILITSFPAGYVFAGTKQQRQRTGKRMNDMGYCKGMPDLFIPYPIKSNHGDYCGLFIELKSESGRVNKEQQSTGAKLIELGYFVNVVRSIEEFINLVNSYMTGVL